MAGFHLGFQAPTQRFSAGFRFRVRSSEFRVEGLGFIVPLK